MTVDLSKLLSRPVDDAKRPVPLPAGIYHGNIAKFSFDVSKEKKTPFCRFMVNTTSADKSIDPSLLADIDLSKKQLRKDFYLTPDSEYRLADFLHSCGISTAGQSWGASIPNCVNAQVIITVIQKQNQNDPSEFFNEIGDIKGTAA